MPKRAKVLVSVNHKGGVGKSFIVQLLASYFAGIKKLNVLAIDFDPQGNLSTRFLNDVKKKTDGYYTPPIHPEYDPNSEDEWDGYSSAAHIFFDKPGMEIVAYDTELDNLSLLPSNARLIETLENHRDQMEISYEEAKDIAVDFFDPVKMGEEFGFDVVIIDTPPAMGLVTQSAIKAATHAIIPFEYSSKSYSGLSSMLAKISAINETKVASKQTKLIGFVANKVSYNKRGTQMNYREKMLNSKFGELLLNSEVRDTVDADRVDTVGEDLLMPFTGLEKGKILREDATALGEEVYKALGL